MGPGAHLGPARGENTQLTQKSPAFAQAGLHHGMPAFVSPRFSQRTSPERASASANHQTPPRGRISITRELVCTFFRAPVSSTQAKPAGRRACATANPNHACAACALVLAKLHSLYWACSSCTLTQADGPSPLGATFAAHSCEPSCHNRESQTGAGDSTSAARGRPVSCEMERTPHHFLYFTGALHTVLQNLNRLPLNVQQQMFEGAPHPPRGATLQQGAAPALALLRSLQSEFFPAAMPAFMEQPPPREHTTGAAVAASSSQPPGYRARDSATGGQQLERAAKRPREQLQFVAANLEMQPRSDGAARCEESKQGMKRTRGSASATPPGSQDADTNWLQALQPADVPEELVWELLQEDLHFEGDKEARPAWVCWRVETRLWLMVVYPLPQDTLLCVFDVCVDDLRMMYRGLWVNHGHGLVRGPCCTALRLKRRLSGPQRRRCISTTSTKTLAA